LHRTHWHSKLNRNSPRSNFDNSEVGAEEKEEEAKEEENLEEAVAKQADEEVTTVEEGEVNLVFEHS
jgi:hypothetical protein